MSPIPASARNASATGKMEVSPKATIAAPQSRPAPITTRPGLRTWLVHPLVAAPMMAPSAGAAASSPNVDEPPWKWSRARAGNRAVGMPKIIALVSMSSIPPRTGLRRT